ncbi:MAG TPA: aminotransferase class V-fold PLP-dependent enzyme [Acetobacteraceae bacterium]|nr:aminotransferase class V-fold PLP-dependent enzyme [Acetobacteraceae bacterium]
MPSSFDPPAFDLRAFWALDPDYLTVNHGSFGATPGPVLIAQAEWRQCMEQQPTAFFTRILPRALAAARAALAGFLGARPGDLAFVENATAGLNAVLRSLPFAPGDEILCLDHGHGAIRQAIAHACARSGARMRVAALPFPGGDADGVEQAVAGALTARTRLAVLDHIAAPSGLVLPIGRLVALCRERGVPVLVDAAQGPGQAPLDLGALGADYVAGNCHKWLFAPKGCGFLWAAPERRVGLHPLAISHGFGQGYHAEFDWTGTRDPSAFLAVGEAIRFFHALGGAALMARNAALAAEGAALLAAWLGTETARMPEMQGAMGVVRLTGNGASPAQALALRAQLLELGTDAPVFPIGPALWLRISAQAYNTLADYERLARLVAPLAGAL